MLNEYFADKILCQPTWNFKKSKSRIILVYNTFKITSANFLNITANDSVLKMKWYNSDNIYLLTKHI